LGFFAYGWRAITEKYATFSGRARRKEYWAFALIYFLLIFIAATFEALIDFSSGTAGDPSAIGPGVLLIILVVVGLIVPAIAVSVRRLHDLGMSGWWALIQIIPYIGAIIFFVFTVLPGQPQSNAYGPPTKPEV
jgi:uncharacterized membrane protein YhaH (DUF805 family)